MCVFIHTSYTDAISPPLQVGSLDIGTIYELLTIIYLYVWVWVWVGVHDPYIDTISEPLQVGSLDIGTIYESLTGEIGAAYDSHFEALFSEVRDSVVDCKMPRNERVNPLPSTWASRRHY